MILMSFFFFVDLLENYENSILLNNFVEIVNSAVFLNKPVVIIGYNKGLVEGKVDAGLFPNFDVVKDGVTKPFLEKRSKHVSCQFVNFNSLEEIKEILNIIISRKINSQN